jgi:cytochrome c-type biogenesis protein CcmH
MTTDRSRGVKQAVSRVATISLLAVVVWGVATGIVHNAPGDRLYEVTSRIRCPLCQGESVAESPSGSAQDITDQVRQQIEAGWTDRQIEQFYVDRYGSWILLDPPRTGGRLLLWAIPLVAVTGGVIAVISLLEPSKRRTRLTFASAALGAATLGTMVVLGVLQRDPPLEAAPPLTTVAETRDLAEVGNDEMEAVVAENPTVVGMRLALAQRYLEAGDLDDAYRHTTIAIDLPATDQEYERSLRLHGWITALRGAPDSGAGYLRAALALSPDDRDAWWYLARVQFSGLGDPVTARAALDHIDTTGMTEEQRGQFDQLSAMVDEALVDGVVDGAGSTATDPRPSTPGVVQP